MRLCRCEVRAFQWVGVLLPVGSAFFATYCAVGSAFLATHTQAETHPHHQSSHAERPSGIPRPRVPSLTLVCWDWRDVEKAVVNFLCFERVTCCEGGRRAVCKVVGHGRHSQHRGGIDETLDLVQCTLRARKRGHVVCCVGKLRA